jgi:hypothetical protein
MSTDSLRISFSILIHHILILCISLILINEKYFFIFELDTFIHFIILII